jgi:hypothetical protein
MTDIARDPEELLDEYKAAKFLAVSPRTLQAWRTNKSGPPYVTAGRMVRYRRGALIEWTQSRTRHPESALPHG